METADSSGQDYPPLIPIPQWPDYFPWPPIGGLRHLRFYCETNGFEDAFVKVNGRVLVDPDAFFRIAKEQGQQKNGS